MKPLTLITLITIMMLALAGCTSDAGQGTYVPIDGSSPGPGLDGGGDGETGPGTCGDGVCDPGENVFSCRADCDAPEILGCIAGACPDVLAECVDSEPCQAALACLIDCGEADRSGQCEDACTAGVDGDTEALLDDLKRCADEAGCETGPVGSCEGRCGEVGDAGRCACDGDCAVFGDCCEDYLLVCVGDCGDGVCAGGENRDTCPQDCEGPEPGFCGDGSCRGEEDEDTCPEDCDGTEPGYCGDGICDGPETSDSCPDDCPRLPGCGDGQCTPPESAANCPDDCGEAPFCGDGFCGKNEGPETCPEDCGGPDTCGDGVCEDSETPASCPDDCEGPDPCGDGVCGPDETVTSCPADCYEGPGGIVGCAFESCPGEVQSCLDDPSCAPIVTCAGGCAEGDMDCLQGCLTQGGFSGAAISLGLCIYNSGCLDGGGPECGNGQCEQGESPDTCPADCSGDQVWQCIQDSCPDEVGICFDDPDCVGILECFDGCADGDSACIQGCIADHGYPDSFATFWDCVSASGCIDEQPNPVCGDGICDPGEQGSCAADCGEGGLLACLEESCADALAVCQDDAACADALPCLLECVDSGGNGCTYQCMPPGGNDALYQLGTCGGQAGCGNNGG